MCVHTRTIYKLPHGFSYRRLLGLRVQHASLKALASAYFPILCWVFLLISIRVKAEAIAGPVQVPKMLTLEVTIKHGEVLSEFRVNFDALWK